MYNVYIYIYIYMYTHTYCTYRLVHMYMHMPAPVAENSRWGPSLEKRQLQGSQIVLKIQWGARFAELLRTSCTPM